MTYLHYPGPQRIRAFTSHSHVDRHLANAELEGEFTLRDIAHRVACPHLLCLLNRQGDSVGHTSLARHISGVFCVATKKQVRRITAWRVVAVVADVHARRGNVTVRQNPRGPLGIDWAVRDAQPRAAVAETIPKALPFPAFIRTAALDVRPESVRDLRRAVDIFDGILSKQLSSGDRLPSFASRALRIAGTVDIPVLPYTVVVHIAIQSARTRLATSRDYAQSGRSCLQPRKQRIASCLPSSVVDSAIPDREMRPSTTGNGALAVSASPIGVLLTLQMRGTEAVAFMHTPAIGNRAKTGGCRLKTHRKPPASVATPRGIHVPPRHFHASILPRMEAA